LASSGLLHLLLLCLILRLFILKKCNVICHNFRCWYLLLSGLEDLVEMIAVIELAQY
jgi:hypothetical protein